MPKLDRRAFLSFEDYIGVDIFSPHVEEFRFSKDITRQQYAYLYDIKDNSKQKKYGKRHQLLGSLQPFASMAKDFKDTFKPYKGKYQLFRDGDQLTYGVQNLGRACLNLLGVPIAFIVNTVKYAFSPKTFVEKMKVNCARTASWLLDIPIYIIRGTTQIITAPLTWFLKIPVRLVITFLKGMQKKTEKEQKVADKNASSSGRIHASRSIIQIIATPFTWLFKIERRALTTFLKGTPNIEERKSIQRLVQKGQKVAEENSELSGPNMDTIALAIHEKFMESRKRRQISTIDSRREDSFWTSYNTAKNDDGSDKTMTAVKKEHALNYLGLFSTVRQSLPSPSSTATELVDVASDQPLLKS